MESGEGGKFVLISGLIGVLESLEIVEAHYKVLRFGELGTNVEKEINLGVRRVEDLASVIFTSVRSLGTSSWRQKVMV